MNSSKYDIYAIVGHRPIACDPMTKENIGARSKLKTCGKLRRVPFLPLHSVAMFFLSVDIFFPFANYLTWKLIMQICFLLNLLMQWCATYLQWNSFNHFLQWFISVYHWMIMGTDYGRSMKPFSLKFQTFGLGKTNWADRFCGIWGIFGWTISTHFDTVSPLPMFSIIQPIFFKKLSLYIHIPNVFLGLGFIFEFGLQRIRDLALVCP